MTPKELVKTTLENHSLARDKDIVLIYRVLELINPQYPAMSLQAILGKIERKEIPSFGTISRWGRKIKEENISLRGNEYRERKSKKVEYVQGLMKL